MLQPANVVFEDAELWATGFMRAALATRPESYAQGVHVNNKVPNPRRSRMVIFRRDGGPRLEGAREVWRLNCRVWAMKEQDASDLAQLVRSLMWACPNGAPVLRVDDSGGPSWVPDSSEQPQLSFTLELVVRGAPLPADLEP